jgi:GrpB-like predicted nucleotidyltransferase (UPF0157 family)/predicted nucleotidyltransferase
VAQDEPVRIAPYDPSWPDRFEAEKALLERTIGPWVTGGIHHVGSTAVPGLVAKPVIDMLVGVKDLASSRECFERLAKLNYQYAPYRAEEMHWFCKPNPAHRTHHLHLVPTGSLRYRAELAFRDRLRARPDVARRYQRLKEQLAVEHRDDREAYTEAKQGFIAEALALHKREKEVDEVTAKVADWARSRPDIDGMALVGSWARKTGRMDSDVDLIVISAHPEQCAQNGDWLAALGDPLVVRRQLWGVVAETRCRLQSGLEVELGVAPASWATTDPVDAGTRKVVEDGVRILVDPRRLLQALVAAIGRDQRG